MQDPTNEGAAEDPSVRQEPARAPEHQLLLRPAVACPRCGSRPALRITVPLAEAVAGQPGARRVGTYQCQRRGCGAVYDLPAEAFRQAR
jgi:hypothetical protein